jgi:D-sedoheptulose 7-phosphate isomerase
MRLVKLSARVDRIRSNIIESQSIKQAALNDPELIDTIAVVAEQMVESLRGGGKVFFFGNGGSASDAQHLAAEFVGRFERARRALPAIALTSNTATLTALGNDYSYEQVFARQLEALGSPSDVAVGISTSGRSSNVIAAARAAKAKGILSVGMTGLEGGQLATSVDHCIRVPSDRTARIQEVHILIGHILCEIVEEDLFSDDKTS